MTCRWDRDAKKHLTREHLTECVTVACKGCRPCTHDEDGNPARHCRARNRCTSHLGWDDHTCPECVGKIRGYLNRVVDLLALMPREATQRGVDSEPANLAGPHADYVTASWRLINADRAGESVDELDMRDPYTCLTMHERMIREDLGHDETTLVSPTISEAVSYLGWVLTDLARDEEQVETLAALLGDAAVLVGHLETALRDSRTPERGIPCPECTSEEAGVGPRLVRHHGHWCTKDDCRQVHYLDDSGDVWRCPKDFEHEWTHADYEARLVERRRTA